MATKKNIYNNEELDWLEQRAEDIRRDVDSTPYNEITDRIIPLQGARGITETIAQRKEDIQKAMRDALKDYALLIEVIGKLREQEEAKAEAKGNSSIPFRMQ